MPAPTKSATSQGDLTRAKIKKFIADYWKRYGYAPSIGEIAKGVGLSSHNGVRTHLLVMRSNGEITWQEGRYRTIRVVGQ